MLMTPLPPGAVPLTMVPPVMSMPLAPPPMALPMPLAQQEAVPVVPPPPPPLPALQPTFQDAAIVQLGRMGLEEAEAQAVQPPASAAEPAPAVAAPTAAPGPGAEPPEPVSREPPAAVVAPRQPHNSTPMSWADRAKASAAAASQPKTGAVQRPPAQPVRERARASAHTASSDGSAPTKSRPEGPAGGRRGEAARRPQREAPRAPNKGGESSTRRDHSRGPAGARSQGAPAAAAPLAQPPQPNGHAAAEAAPQAEAVAAANMGADASEPEPEPEQLRVDVEADARIEQAEVLVEEEEEEEAGSSADAAGAADVSSGAMSAEAALAALRGEASSWQPPPGGSRLAPRGLHNPGNLCFMNSVVQALMGGGSFCHLLCTLRSAAPALDAARLPTLAALAQMAAEFQRLDVVQASGGAKDWASVLGGHAVSPAPLMDLVHRFSTQRRLGTSLALLEQEDAQEFLAFVMESLHEELLLLRADAGSGAAPAARPGARAHGAARAGPRPRRAAPAPLARRR